MVVIVMSHLLNRRMFALPDSEMSVLDDHVLRAIGARPTGLRSNIPLYMRISLVRTKVSPGTVITREVQRDISYQEMSALVLEIPDFARLRRYEIVKKKIIFC